MCNECAISVIKTQVEMSLASNADIISGLSMVVSSCKTTVEVTTPPAASPPWVTKATPVQTSAITSCIPSSSFAGKMYAMQSRDTCQSIAKAQRIDTVQLLMANNLVLCIPSAAICEPYVIKNGDTCTSIVNGAKAMWAQIVSWNPELGRSCQNVADYVGFVVCVSNPGGSWVDTHPAATGTTTPGVTITAVE
ncbi:uncharacterized protein ColSpa_11151 [Colletotrichum spaethianum]|uniref:LysM domain-containing protein n=1 Tax=Colletotrichum spaethianum TaxID=700344 RepID=A0AA37UPM5_9PEZI|nr:uncharacterized protein ColSpa_11151 [Colletotrichum spaethianum]GKT50970.1 hypothetical protein ColSpa_11151 [Colletotrichum spaethianum]